MRTGVLTYFFTMAVAIPALAFDKTWTCEPNGSKGASIGKLTLSMPGGLQAAKMKNIDVTGSATELKFGHQKVKETKLKGMTSNSPKGIVISFQATDAAGSKIKEITVNFSQNHPNGWLFDNNRGMFEMFCK